MTPDNFDVALSRTRMRPESRGTLGARLVLIDGLSNSEAARRVGATPDAIRQASARIRRAQREMMGLPPGWICISVALPAERNQDLHDAVESIGGQIR